jgi:hypothetical protein
VGEQRYIEVSATAILTHEEHGPMTLEPGVYEDRRQREYNWRELRFVAD